VWGLLDKSKRNCIREEERKGGRKENGLLRGQAAWHTAYPVYAFVSTCRKLRLAITLPELAAEH